MEVIKRFRKHIDRIDLVLITALAERMQLMDEIGTYKKKKNISIFSEKRDQEIMERLKKYAEEYDLDVGFVEEIFESVLNESKRLQQEASNKAD